MAESLRDLHRSHGVVVTTSDQRVSSCSKVVTRCGGHIPYQSTHGRFEVVLGKGIHPFSYIVNCLENSSDPNYFVAFAVNSIDLHGCPPDMSDNLYQDGTPTSDFRSPASRWSRVQNLHSVTPFRLHPTRRSQPSRFEFVILTFHFGSRFGKESGTGLLCITWLADALECSRLSGWTKRKRRRI
jgi:hypothetical protein